MFEQVIAIGETHSGDFYVLDRFTSAISCQELAHHYANYNFRRVYKVLDDEITREEIRTYLRNQYRYCTARLDFKDFLEEESEW